MAPLETSEGGVRSASATMALRLVRIPDSVRERTVFGVEDVEVVCVM